jgi:hypothetical protein
MRNRTESVTLLLGSQSNWAGESGDFGALAHSYSSSPLNFFRYSLDFQENRVVNRHLYL